MCSLSSRRTNRQLVVVSSQLWCIVTAWNVVQCSQCVGHLSWGCCGPIAPLIQHPCLMILVNHQKLMCGNTTSSPPATQHQLLLLIRLLTKQQILIIIILIVILIVINPHLFSIITTNNQKSGHLQHHLCIQQQSREDVDVSNTNSTISSIPFFSKLYFSLFLFSFIFHLYFSRSTCPSSIKRSQKSKQLKKNINGKRNGCYDGNKSLTVVLAQQFHTNNTKTISYFTTPLINYPLKLLNISPKLIITFLLLS